ncbi:glycosyltransferase family 2 protein [Fervidibacter sacchari]|uniref:Glycosyltransferase involved in cell wall biosynthesis n=1 Tax=Candidatus Fervidibacter sacchari TaxID=1448929 RepID=A0ABT2ET11_9BACT|nr:glycosyltransferase family 2 protein [Candidatus Fervidibacter sacchari]MCS3921081.1 glycosyltransferase involved in cell wall biosynthesis [Candidatus Fervidibacter sacchari]WKU16563.1 glycosyltransferase family 2 protein [Candidatus Fervidibacter sacchari]
MAKPKLTIVIPVYNERGTVMTVLEKVKSLPVSKEIIVIDNLSTDGTRELLETVSDPEIRVVLQSKNLGKGTSVKLGFAMAKGEWVIIQDADLEYEPTDILRLLEHAEKTGEVAVFGSRLLTGNPQGMLAFYIGRVVLNLIFRLLFGAKTTDVATCYKLVRSDIAKRLRLRCSGFDLDFELASALRRLGYNIAEVPITYRPRTIAEGKKIRPMDGVKAIATMLRVRLQSRETLMRPVTAS